MFEKEKWSAGTLLAPVPAVLISCGDMEKSNILTVAWTGIINSDPAKTYISIRKERFSYDIIKNTKEFVINLTTKDLVFATDFCGVRSGKNIDKFKQMNLSKQPANEVVAPLIGESPVNIECRVTDIIELGSHDMFISDILCVDVDKNLLDDKGKLDLTKANLIAYSHGEYFTLGEKLGKFGFSVKKK